MAEAESNLPVEVKDLTFTDTLTHLGKQFTKDEKRRFFNELPGKKYKIGSIRSKDLSNLITIYTESFDLSKKKLAKETGVFNKDCSTQSMTNDLSPEERWPMRPNENDDLSMRPNENDLSPEDLSMRPNENDDESPDLLMPFNLYETPHNKSPRSELPKSELPKSESSKSESSKSESSSSELSVSENKIPIRRSVRIAAQKGGDAFEEDDEPTLVSKSIVKTSSDFERLYLGWMNDKQRKNTMKSLFRFIFGNKDISDVTATTYQKKFRIAYTPLTPDDKVPCRDNALWDDFRKSLNYRRNIAMCEIGARAPLGENNLHIERLKILVPELIHLIDVIDAKEYACMDYGHDETQHEVESVEEEKNIKSLNILHKFIKNKKE